MTSSCPSRSSLSTCAGAWCVSEPPSTPSWPVTAIPTSVARVIGEAAALTVMLGSSLKLEGRFQLQTKTDGIIDMVVVDFNAPDRLRATARFDKDKLEALEPPHRERASFSAPAISP